MRVAELVLSIAGLVVGLVSLGLTWFAVIPELRERTPGDGILPRPGADDD